MQLLHSCHRSCVNVNHSGVISRLLSNTRIQISHTSIISTLRRTITTQTNITEKSTSTTTTPTSPIPCPHSRVQSSVKYYDRHLFIASRHSAHHTWNTKIEDEITINQLAHKSTPPAQTLFAQLTQAMKAYEFTSRNPLRVGSDIASDAATVSVCPRITLFDITQQNSTPSQTETSNPSFSEGDVLVLSQSEPPFHIRSKKLTALEVMNLSIRQSVQQQITHFPELRRLMHIMKKAVMITDVMKTTVAAVSPPSLHLIAFVCCHAQRDERCGRRGPVLVNEINRWSLEHSKRISQQLKQPISITAYPCSHVGQHEFAGNVLFYAWRSESVSTDSSSSIAAPFVLNDWFGLIQPNQIPALLDSYTQFMSSTLQSTPLHEMNINDCRRRMLNHTIPLQPISDAAAAECSTCHPPPSSAASTLSELWRGSMGMDKSDARTLLQSMQSQSQVDIDSNSLKLK